VAEKSEAEFELTIPIEELGAGPVVLRAEASFGDQIVASPPHTVKVAIR
jgi:hypothetical protein